MPMFASHRMPKAFAPIKKKFKLQQLPDTLSVQARVEAPQQFKVFGSERALLIRDLDAAGVSYSIMPMEAGKETCVLLVHKQDMRRNKTVLPVVTALNSVKEPSAKELAEIESELAEEAPVDEDGDPVLDAEEKAYLREIMQ